MSFSVPTTIPNVHYDYLGPPSYPFSAPQYEYNTLYSGRTIPPPNTILHDQLFKTGTDCIRARHHIRNLLKWNQLCGLPIGFPFHSVPLGRACGTGRASGEMKISHSSYEFTERLRFPDQGQVKEMIFEYSSPEKSGNGMMCWKIYLPATRRDTKAPMSPLPIAHVEAPRMVFETSFGIDLATNPLIILKALAISVERGISLAFHVIDKQKAKTYPPCDNAYYNGEVVLVVIDPHGRPIDVVSVEDI